MAALLYDAAKQGPNADFAAHVLTHIAHGGVQGAARSSLPRPQEHSSALDPLTDREMDVLALLGQRLSNKEIAAVLVVSPWTVKTHTHNVFSKLQAKNRREAVARARSLGLLNSLS
jgi:LuxR family maltose regulon positive regulatory protein